jgi:catechol 2,3-dioxygenase-like lactoylglutathione lyase family enzyme
VIHHVVLGVSDVEQSGAFYDALLAPLGWRRHLEDDGTVGWGIAKPVFFVTQDERTTGAHGLVSFSAPGIAAVKAAWEGGLAHGGSGIDPPGEARRTGSGSYSAFISDPDGHSVEVTVGSD